MFHFDFRFTACASSVAHNKFTESAPTPSTWDFYFFSLLESRGHYFEPASIDSVKKKNDGHWLHGAFRAPTQDELLKQGGVISGKAINTQQVPYSALLHILKVFCPPEGLCD